LSLVVAVFAVRAAGRQFVGESFRALARQQARHLGTLLSDQIDQIQLINSLPGTEDFLRRAQAPPLSQRQIQAIEAAWPDLGPQHPLLQSILNNELANRWQAIQRFQPRIAEVIITDATGRTIAATGKPEDYFQGDEHWWQHCATRGPGQPHLQNIARDPSAISAEGSPGAVVAPVCLPIRGEQPDAPPSLLGVIKVALDAGWMIRQVRDAPVTGAYTFDRQIWLVDQDGRVVLGVGQQPPFDRLPERIRNIMREHSDGYVIRTELPEKDVVGFARVPLPARVSADTQWQVLVTAPGRDVLASTRWTVWLILIIGATFITGCFIIGLWIAQREIIRPLLLLRHGAEELEKRNFSYRLPGPGIDGSPFRNDEIGQLAGEFNHMASQLQHDMDELARSNAVQQQFIDVASHELRTPITYIAGVAELAQRQRGDCTPFLGKIAAKAQRLGRIVENMFKLLKSGAYDAVLHLGEVDVEQAIDEVAAELEPFIRSRSQNLQITLPPVVRPLLADREKLHDILNNLLSNAIRFSPDGATLGLKVESSEAEVEFIISDQGPGIDPEHLAHIFEPFYAAASEVTTHTSGEFEHMTRGIGLGLSVVKRFAEMHGGSVSVQSAPTGSTFRVRLPRRHPQAQLAAASQQQAR
jgi:two-component system, OmpR family, sensor kinase